MFKRNHIYIAVVATSMSLGSSQIFAQESVSSVATINVSNAFTFTEVAPIDFGTVRLLYRYDTSDFTAAATFTVNANGTPSTAVDGAGVGDASFTEIIPGAPAEYSITAAAPFTPIFVDAIPTVNLTNPASPGATLAFTVGDTNFEIVGGANPGDGFDRSSATSNMVTDAAGEVGFLMGGTLSTLLIDETYGDGNYTGTYTVTVRY